MTNKMNNPTISSKPILLIGICILFLSSTQVKKDKLPDPQIAAGIAKVAGKVTGFHLKKGEANPILKLEVPNPVTAEPGNFETHLSDDGSFHFEVPVECTINIGMIYSDIFNHNCFSIGLIPGEVTKLEISYDATDHLKATMVSSLGLTSSDLPYYYKMFMNFIDYDDVHGYYTMTPEDFSHIAIEKLMVQRMKSSIIDSLISDKAKNLITNQCKLMYLGGALLTYKDYITTNYWNKRLKGEPDNFTAQEPNRSYYAFLKDFNLSDPQYLYNDLYPRVLKNLLSNKTLNIPAIKDMPVEVWLKEVKTIMADLIGSDTGLFYDMLAANTYAKQFNKELKPLSDIQKDNIRSYFKNKEITKILLNKNEEVIKLDEEKQHTITNINTTPSVPKVDLHVHLNYEAQSLGNSAGEAYEKASLLSKKMGVTFGIAEEFGNDNVRVNDSLVLNRVALAKKNSLYLGLQVSRRDWTKIFTEETLNKVDYILADALIFPNKEGKMLYIWVEGMPLGDPLDFMGLYVAHNLKVLSEPITIWANPTYLPDKFNSRYDELWTDARMKSLIDAAIKNNVAIEINSRFKIPNAKFIKMAKAARAHFTFGTNQHETGIGEIDWSINMAKECGLTKEDFFIPKRKL